MADIFAKWDKSMDTEGLAKDTKEAEANGGSGEYAEIPVGTYEVKVEKMELKECQSEKNAGKPMFFCQFRILNGDHENQCLFRNNLIDEGWKIGQINTFLRSLDSGVDVEFVNYGQYNNLIMDIMEAIDGKLEFLLSYTKNKKGYDVFEIKEVYEV